VAQLDDSQRRAVEEPTLPLAVLAGPGSGKTRVLSQRIAHQVATGSVEAERVLAVTFTRKAAGELNDRLHSSHGAGHVTAGTFHALCLGLLRRWYDDRGREVPALLERKAPILAPLLGGGTEAAAAVTPVAAEIEWAKARGVGPDGYVAAVEAAGRDTPRAPAELAALYERYEKRKRRANLMDFDDLILRCALRLEDDDDFASATRWRFRHFFVDEFQDVSPSQFRLLRAWLGDRTDLFVVGDPDQAIFSFTGADPAYLTRFAEHFPGATVVELTSSHRCPPQVLRPARRLLEGRAPGRALSSAVDPGPEPHLTGYSDAAAEARGVADALVEAHAAGRRWADLAVLYRTNAQSALFEEELARRDIPVRLRGARRFLDRPEVRADLARLRSSSGDLRARLAGLSAPAPHVRDGAGPGVTDTERAEHTEALVALGHEYLRAEGGDGSLPGFLAFLATALRGDSDGGATADAVDLVTFHRSKGLEWHTVIVTGVEAGFVPISHARSAPEKAEERRLLYVACTRSRHTLHLTWAEQRSFGTRDARRTPSPLLADMGLCPTAGDPPVTTGGRPTDATGRIRELRATLRRGVPSGDAGDDALARELKDWRHARSRAAGVPAYVVFADTTLAELVLHRPSNREELLGVSGIGPVKAERFGPDVLDIVARHVRAGPRQRTG